MTTMVLVGVAVALAVFAITMRARAGKPKKAEKRERARIVKRLLALSEREQMVKGISRQQPVSQSPAPRRRATARRGAPIL